MLGTDISAVKSFVGRGGFGKMGISLLGTFGSTGGKGREAQGGQSGGCRNPSRPDDEGRECKGYYCQSVWVAEYRDRQEGGRRW